MGGLRRSRARHEERIRNRPGTENGRRQNIAHKPGHPAYRRQPAHRRHGFDKFHAKSFTTGPKGFKYPL